MHQGAAGTPTPLQHPSQGLAGPPPPLQHLPPGPEGTPTPFQDLPWGSAGTPTPLQHPQEASAGTPTPSQYPPWGSAGTPTPLQHPQEASAGTPTPSQYPPWGSAGTPKPLQHLQEASAGIPTSNQQASPPNFYPHIPSYSSSSVEFNFKHGHGNRPTAQSVETTEYLREITPPGQPDGVTSCMLQLESLRESWSVGAPQGIDLGSDLLSKYPNLNPDFEDPSMNVPASNSKFSFMNFLTLQLILLACGQWSCGMSDGNMEFNIKYMYQLLYSLVGFGLASPEITTAFPKTLYQFKKLLGIGGVAEQFTRYVTCQDPSCCATYDFEETYTLDRHGNKIPKVCSSPRYKYGKPDGECGQQLLKYQYSAFGTRVLVPIKTFVWHSISDQIEEKLKRPGIEDACQQWRKDTVPDNVRKDIYSGRVWKELQTKHKYFSSDYELALQYNIDWWQPHKHSNKSIGVMYLAIANLPREIRYKRENLIIAGLIPSLDYYDGKTTRTEPQSLNPFQKYLSEELQALGKHGAKIQTFKHPEGITMKAILLMNASDSPAARKSSGFLAHSALLGCPRCLKVFTGKVGEKHYGGFNDYWPPRTLSQHKEHIRKIRRAKHDTERKQLESKFGCKDSVLNDLPYFNVIRQTIVDPMHNLFQGTAKMFFVQLVERGILDADRLVKLTENLKNIHVPTNSRWIPSDIGSKYTFYNSYQWKEWCLTYSMIAFKGVIPPDHLKVWQTFVTACRLICRPVLTMADANQANVLFKQFGTELEQLWGSNAVKPNQHMHCHLAECIDDFGSPYSFWLFPFERYNGDLGGLTTNCQSMEVTYMRKFLEMSAVAGLVSSLPREQRLLYAPYLKHFSFSPSTVTVGYDELCLAPTRPLSECGKVWQLTEHISTCKKKRQKTSMLDEDDRVLLRQMYQQMYPNNDIQTTDVNEFYYDIKKLYIEGTRLCTLGTDPARHCYVMAHWPDEHGLISSELSSQSMGRLNNFIEHKVRLNGQYVTHILCSVDWKQEFHDSMPSGYLSPCKVFRNVTKHRGMPCTYMPIQRIHSICAHSIQRVNGFDNCIVTVGNQFHLLLNDNCHN